jgi:hypothetical protein
MVCLPIGLKQTRARNYKLLRSQESILPAYAARARICKCLWSTGIDSNESIPPSCVAWRASTTNRVVVLVRESIPGLLKKFTNTVQALARTSNRVVIPTRQAGNRFLGLLKMFTNPGSEMEYADYSSTPAN